MKRNLWLALGIVALLLMAGAWAMLRRAEPWRLPEVFGTVEQVRDAGPDSPPMFLVRCRQPDPGQNANQRGYVGQMWVWVQSGTPVRHRGGGVGQVAVGQTVSAWYSGGVM